MSILFLLIGFSLALALLFLALFFWAVRTGQFDDRETPAMRMLFDAPAQQTTDQTQQSGRPNQEDRL